MTEGLTMNWRALHFKCLALVCALANLSARADSWAAPTVQNYRSANGEFGFVVQPRPLGVSDNQPAKGIFRRQDGPTNLWERPLVNKTAPVQVLIPDSGRFVVTMDEWHSVGENPVVIYDAAGKLIKHLTLEDLKLKGHPKIKQSVSSYWWNEYAFIFFGPTNHAALSRADAERLEDLLFIRLHWGEIKTIDLRTGTVRHGEWWQVPPAEDQGLKAVTKAFLDRTWEEFVEKNFRPENFEPDPGHAGTQGLMLVTQLKRKDAIPLVRKLASTDRFQHWAAPPWDEITNLRDYARRSLKELEQ